MLATNSRFIPRAKRPNLNPVKGSSSAEMDGASPTAARTISPVTHSAP